MRCAAKSAHNLEVSGARVRKRLVGSCCY